MVDVTARIAQYEAMRPRLSDNLKKFLDLVWTHRNNPKIDIYALYSGSPIWTMKYRQKSDYINLSAARTFLRKLDAEIPYNPEMQVGDDLTRQIYYRWSNQANDWVRRARPLTFHQLIEIDRRTPVDWMIKDMATAFFHYRRRKADVAERIYLNVKPAFVIEVMKYIVTNMVMNPTDHPELVNGKIAAPGEPRFDTIVLYLLTKKGVETALAELAKYQSKRVHQGYFNFASTRMTKQVTSVGTRTLQGVSIGSEPPSVALKACGVSGQLELKKKSQSFGGFREHVITIALDRTKKAGGNKNAFVNNVLKIFEKLGLDPRNPHLQMDRADLELAGKQAKRIDLGF